MFSFVCICTSMVRVKYVAHKKSYFQVIAMNFIVYMVFLICVLKFVGSFY
jgi:hypothetical protein